jgi:hypothetical protein
MTYVREKLRERRIGVVAEVVAYSLWVKGIGGKEGRVTGCDQWEARDSIGAWAVALSSGEEGGECWSRVDSGDEGYSL